MTWLARFALWTTALSVLAIWIGPAYRDVLSGAVQSLLRPIGAGMHIRELRVQQPLQIALFAALCLAGRRSSPRRKGAALAIGMPVLAVVGYLTLVGIIWAVRALGAHGVQLYEPVPRFLAMNLDTLPWVAAPGLWLLLLGGRELSPEVLRRWSGGDGSSDAPRARRASPGRRKARRS